MYCQINKLCKEITKNNGIMQFFNFSFVNYLQFDTICLVEFRLQVLLQVCCKNNERVNCFAAKIISESLLVQLWLHVLLLSHRCWIVYTLNLC